MNKITDCPDCKVKPGTPHLNGCDIEICSVCGEQFIQCGCAEHDKSFARWSGIWPGKAEAEFLGMDLMEFAGTGTDLYFLIKPEVN